jgi:DNA-directed RNA polymerase sigma subunit (sigma70/sigma32)
MSYKLKEKTARNTSLLRMALKHPDMTDDDLGKVYHITKQRVGQILKAEKLKQSQKVRG